MVSYASKAIITVGLDNNKNELKENNLEIENTTNLILEQEKLYQEEKAKVKRRENAIPSNEKIFNIKPVTLTCDDELIHNNCKKLIKTIQKKDDL